MTLAPRANALRHRIAFGLLDQGSYSVGTLGVTMGSAHVAGSKELATFTLVLSMYYVVLSVARNLTTAPVIILQGGSSRGVLAVISPVRRINMLPTMIVAILAMIMCASRGQLDMGAPLLVALIPQILLDVERYLLIARGRIAQAAITAGGSAIVLLSLMATLLATQTLTLANLLYLWGVVSGIAAYILRVLNSTHGIDTRAPVSEYLRRSWAGMSSLTVESVVLAFSTQAVLFFLAAYSTDARVVGYRMAGAVALGPWTTLLMGVMPQLQMAIKRWVQEGKRVLTKVFGALAAVCAGTALFTLIVDMAPHAVWIFALGNAAQHAQNSLWSASVVLIATSGGGVAWMYLRYPMGIARTSIVRSITTGLLLMTFWALVVHGNLWRSFAIYAGGLLCVAVVALAVGGRWVRGIDSQEQRKLADHR